jgi:hypothetical protein
VSGKWISDWRAYVTKHRLVAALVGGLVATHVATNLGMWFHGLGLPDLNFNILNGYLVFGNAANAFGTEGMQDPVTLTLFGAGAHYAQGVIFGLIFAFGVHPLIPLPNTVVGNVVKAVIWGLVLAVLSAAWWINLFPNLAGAGTPAGFFFSNFGPDQMTWLAALFLWHVVWGFNLGLFYNPADLPQPIETDAAVLEAEAIVASAPS